MADETSVRGLVPTKWRTHLGGMVGVQAMRSLPLCPREDGVGLPGSSRPGGETCSPQTQAKGGPQSSAHFKFPTLGLQPPPYLGEGNPRRRGFSSARGSAALPLTTQNYDGHVPDLPHPAQHCPKDSPCRFAHRGIDITKAWYSTSF